MAVSFFATMRELRAYISVSQDKSATVKFDIVGKIEENDDVFNQLNLMHQPQTQVIVTVMTENEYKDAQAKKK